jgi:hypothetical protein
VTAATAEAVAAPTAAAESTGAGFARPGFIYRQSPAAQFGAVQSSHGLVRISIYRHFHKRETASLTRIPILHNLYSIYLPVCGKSRIQILLGGLERDVPDIDVLQGVLLIFCIFCRSGRLISKRANLGRKHGKAGKVAVGGLIQPRFHGTSLFT